MDNRYSVEDCDVLKMNCVGKPCQNDLDNLPLAMAYVPWQKWNKVYTQDVALKRGTIFPELDLPFLGEEVM